MKIKTKTQAKTKFIAFLLASIMLFSLIMFTACSDDSKAVSDLTKDREGNSINLPASIEKIASIGPSNTVILTALGLGDKIIAIDTYASHIEGIKSDLPQFDMMALDAEQMVSLMPDVVFVTGMTKVGGEDTYAPVKMAGICVIYIPASDSIQGIKNDIQYIADVMNVTSKGKDIVKNMEKEINDIKKISDKITDKKSVYFDMFMYSFGSGVFLNEMIELIGATNILSSYTGWMSVTDEIVVSANPDVIFTSTNFIDDPIGEVKARPGWDSITAVKNNDVYYIDSNDSNQPTHNIIKALKEMAKAVYPDLYK